MSPRPAPHGDCIRARRPVSGSGGGFDLDLADCGLGRRGTRQIDMLHPLAQFCCHLGLVDFLGIRDSEIGDWYFSGQEPCCCANWSRPKRGLMCLNPGSGVPIKG